MKKPILTTLLTLSAIIPLVLFARSSYSKRASLAMKVKLLYQKSVKLPKIKMMKKTGK